MLPGFGAVPYAPLHDVFDEMMDDGQSVRTPWRGLVDALARLGPEHMAQRWERGQRLIRENGITYTVYGDPQGMERPWRLDPVPLVVGAEAWADIEEALIQRATLFNLLLADLYGPQRVLREGILPPALVHANPAFLRPLVGASVDGALLHFYAADLARSPDGRWWVVGDRTEAPSGAGYAMENRTIVSRVLPEAYRACAVERMAPWFARVRDSLAERAPLNRDNPRIVLLTPGPYNETWFEHAYLARTLGLTLVEGEDLSVRGGRVTLKTTEGLKPVDVILRRTDGAFCDPLELRGDSTLGIPGLVEAVHRGTVTLANSLGSGLVEAPALLAFLPGLCRFLLGEDLAMPSVATWWCGQAAEREYVIANLHRLALRPAFSVATEPVRGATMSAAVRAQWADRLRTDGALWIAQEAVNLSTAPVWTGERIEPRSVVLRVHACAAAGTYAVMPGGLSRTAAAPGAQSVSMQHGGGSKDTWVLAPGPLHHPPSVGSGLLAATLPQVAAPTVAPPGQVARTLADLPSRTADCMFWFGRYIERCEDLCRLLRAAVSRALLGPEAAADLTSALVLFRRLGHLPWDADLASPEGQEAAMARLVTLNLDDEAFYGLAGTLGSAQRVAAVARDRLSLDTWRTVGTLPGRLAPMTPDGDPTTLDDLAAGLSDLISMLLAVAGLGQESMVRGLGWRFMDIGRRIERAYHVLDLLDAAAQATPDELTAALDLALDVLDSQITYRTRYLVTPRFVPVLDLLLTDETNPRAFAFQVARLMEHMDILAPDRTHRLFTAEHRLVISLQAAVRTLALDHLAPRGGSGLPLSEMLGTLRDDLGKLVETLTRQYFVHAAETRHMRTASVLVDAEGLQ